MLTAYTVSKLKKTIIVHNLDKLIYRKFFMVKYSKRTLSFIYLIKYNDESSSRRV